MRPILFLLLALVISEMPAAALADNLPYFRLGGTHTAAASPGGATGGAPLPPDISNAIPPDTPPPSGPPSADGSQPGISVPHHGLLEVAALPGWAWQVEWTGTPVLSQIQVYPQGQHTLVELTVTIRGCALATLGIRAATGTVEFATFRDDTHGACMTPSMADWTAASGQPFPSGVTIVRSASLPPGNGSTYTDTSIAFSVVY